MPELIRIYWRDIPSQVMAKAGRKAEKVMLPDRFQQAIDRAAMRAGKGGSDAYMEDWRRERSPCGSELKAEAEQAASELIASFDDESLERIVKAKGVAGNATGNASGGKPESPARDESGAGDAAARPEP